MKREKKYVDSRRDNILKIVKENPYVRVNELAKKLGVSLITIRRDLQVLDEQKLLKRTHGGAQVMKSEECDSDEISYYRRLIAMYAATLEENGEARTNNTSTKAPQKRQKKK
ncbi:hypothetical protein CG709_17235 [Lachnotalea glycerini]|nr:hypothetical protein CG709_17235 [Lachnotalea glycerini]